ncbi:hypothetical protein AB0D08_33065 [Kitasatospora sp. NPDC048540]|nr:hypothetical protein [Kitasatospora sp. MBT63]
MATAHTANELMLFAPLSDRTATIRATTAPRDSTLSRAHSMKPRQPCRKG